MGVEEQKEEREVLESIFPDEITSLSDTEFRVSIVLDVASEDGNDQEAPSFMLQVQYPEAYPEEAPLLDIMNPNAPKHKFLDIHEDKARLLESLQPIIEENLGMAMVFTLVSTLKENAELLVAERQDVVRAQQEKEAARAEEEENRKFHGTAVTRENFLAWRDRFKAEMAEEERRRQEEKEAEDKKKRGGAKEEKKLTGKEIWERGLAGKVDEDEEGDDGLERLKIDG